MRPLALSILVLVALIAPAASADVPAWVDGPSFRAFCDTLREKTACPGCSCEALTQSPPTAGLDGASGFGTGLVVRLAGAQADGQLNFDQLRVALGSEGKLVDAGVIGEASYPADGRTYGAVEVLESAQRVDMCPGMCPHEPVGMAHVFEVRTSWTTPDDARPDRGDIRTTTELVACFAPDEKTPGCWLTPIGAGTGTWQYDLTGEGNEKRRDKATWSRSYRLSPSGEVTLTLGKPKGKLPAELATKAMAALPTRLHLRDLLTRPGTRPAAR